MNNIPHLNLEKKNRSTKMSADELATLTRQYNLPERKLEELQMEFGCLVQLGKDTAHLDHLKSLGGMADETEEATAPNSPRADSKTIKAALLLDACPALKERHGLIVLKALNALGISFNIT